MKRFAWFALFWIATRVVLHADQETLRAHLLVVYNQVDPESERLARFYALRRGIKSDHVLGLSCSLQESISREEFRQQIQEPIDNYISRQGWIQRRAGVFTAGKMAYPIFQADQNHVWAMVLMRGIPLKIEHDATIKEDPAMPAAFQTNAAAVDSELAVLPVLGLPLNGVIPNPYYENVERSFDDFDARQMILVCRLDAPAPETVRRMIDDSVEAERQRLAGRAYVDARGLKPEDRGYYVCDRWCYDARDSLRREGWLVEFDQQPELVPPDQPWADAALYLGWYASDAAGPMLRPGTFRPGAVAYHLHSFSAATLRSPTTGWTGPLLTAGAAASLGNVFEPYLELTPHIDLLTKGLLQGYTLAEAAYASLRGLSWMATVVGDPLYQPFHAPLLPDPSEPGAVLGIRGEWQSVQVVLKQLRADAVTDPTVVLDRFGSSTLPGLVALEAAGDYLFEISALEAAREQYELAQHQARAAVDVLRLTQKRARLLAGQKQWTDAYNLLLDTAARVPQDLATYGYATLIREISRLPGAPAPPAKLSTLAAPPKP